jgi:hypothetical protein
MEEIGLNISDDRKFAACYREGLVHLDWEEADDEITGGHYHRVWVVRKKITLHVSIEHKSIHSKAPRKRFEIVLGFSGQSESGDIFYLTEPHIEYSLESAMLYGRWQATLIFRLIDGEFTA